MGDQEELATLRQEVIRLTQELDQTSSEKIQSAQYGLVLLEEKENLEVFYTRTARGNRIACMYVKCAPNARFRKKFSRSELGTRAEKIVCMKRIRTVR